MGFEICRESCDFSPNETSISALSPPPAASNTTPVRHSSSSNPRSYIRLAEKIGRKYACLQSLEKSLKQPAPHPFTVRPSFVWKKEGESACRICRCTFHEKLWHNFPPFTLPRVATSLTKTLFAAPMMNLSKWKHNLFRSSLGEILAFWGIADQWMVTRTERGCRQYWLD